MRVSEYEGRFCLIHSCFTIHVSFEVSFGQVTKPVISLPLYLFNMERFVYSLGHK